MRYCAILGLLALAAAALAVTPASWNHASEADFSPGDFDSTVVSSLGEITLSRQLQVLMQPPQAPEAVAALAVDGKTIYAASAVRAVVYKIQGRKAEQFATLPGTMVTCLLWTGKELLAGVGGDDAGIYAIDSSGEASCRWRDRDARYIWAMVAGPKGSIYAATGPSATVYAIDADGDGEAIYQAGKLAKNITCLTRSKSGLLHAGTDESGLVVEINPIKKTGRVILDAQEKEISCLLGDESGGLYVGTADKDKAGGEGAGALKETAAGRGVSGAPAASQPAEEEEPGDEALDESGEVDPAASRSASAPAAEEETAAEGEEVEPSPVVGRLAKPAPGPAALPEGKGNAVYYIRPDGLVRTVFRRPVTVLAMLAEDEQLILGTGNGGSIYSVKTDGDEVAQLANTDAKQVTALAADSEGRIIFATSNKGSVGLLGAKAADKGTYISKALDAGQIAKWGTARAAVRGGGKVTLATRSSNLEETSEGGWSDWSADVPVGHGFIDIVSPAGRFLQYRLTLAAAKGDVPVVEQVEIIYQVGNLAPVVSSVKITPAATPRKGQQEQTGPQPQAYRLIEFTASDTNEDTLVYEIAFRQVGGEGWVTLAEKLEAPTYAWDTRGVGDGVYELRVTADDSPANPPGSALTGHRISPPVIVDNAAPLVTRLAAAVKGKTAEVKGRAEDRGSRVASIHYSVDSQTDWTAVLPTDGIADSPKEDFAFKTEDLAPGPHRIAVRVTDLFGNAGYGTLSVTIAEPATAPASGSK